MNWSSILPRSRYLYFQPYFASSILDTAHTSANASALGKKARQVAYGDVLRRFIGAGFNRRCDMKLTDYFQPWSQYGVAIPGVGIMALTGTLGFDEGFTILPYDGENGSNSIYCHRFLHTLVEIVPSVVPYASNLFAQESPKRLFALDGGGFGCGGVSAWSTARTKSSPSLLRCGFTQDNKRVPGLLTGARSESGFVHNITVILRPELSLKMAAIGKVTELLQERQGEEGISLNRLKLYALLAGGVGLEHLTEKQRTAMDGAELTAVQQGMGVVGVPVGT